MGSHRVRHNWSDLAAAAAAAAVDYPIYFKIVGISDDPKEVTRESCCQLAQKVRKSMGLFHLKERLASSLAPRLSDSELLKSSHTTSFSKLNSKLFEGKGFSSCFSLHLDSFFFFSPCHRAYGILVPGAGIELTPPAQSLNHWTTREAPTHC